MKTRTLMVQGTHSDAGKSALVTGLCRYMVRRGIQVAPFKPQNMALNSAVTIDHGEIGRAQAVQARACGLNPHTDMNPVLLKPNSDHTSQVIIHGQALNNLNAWQYHQYKRIAMNAVIASHQRLTRHYSVIIVEGAGSPAEINLRDGDIANMGFAERIDCPVILIADIDRGGVFAHIVGTLELLSETERRRILGFVINRFRGDIKLLQPGLDWLEQKTEKPVFGVLPYLHNLHLQAEDSIAISQDDGARSFRIIVPKLPRISNHTDFDALRLHCDVHLEFVQDAAQCPGADLIILPGSKSVRDDLVWLQQHGWNSFIARHLRYGGKLIGICGGFQMLGRAIHDPDGIEGECGSSNALALLEIETTLHKHKQLRQIHGTLCSNGITIKGYEIHSGTSTGPALSNPLVNCTDHLDGAISQDDQMIGTYVHGLFDQQEACNSLLTWAGCTSNGAINYSERCEAGIDLMADTIEEFIDMSLLEEKWQEF